MAASANAAAITCICRRDFQPSPAPKGSCVNISLATKARRFYIRSSGEVSAEATETESESPVEVEKGGLISALNVEKAIRGIAITDADHYGRLGLPKGCSYDQVTGAYKKKVEELMNKDLDEDELTNELEVLKESHSILSSVEERRLYDWSIARNEKADKYVWPFEVDKTKTSTETPPPSEPEDVEPTRYVGYFMLAWLLLGFTMSIALNR